ncbi:hypothetical protein [Limnochorda pilosa]|uniref:Uncharacterized protein n=1 Tax=Limnochorda pilosa TaxID=1555112 RepID=A0A0K2SGN2_LIMPI|nr:hypothetical protein [Limnochorda pilosa]BAS26182.1 hypothetical protein LIP_0325 [Limnochorda pilosa]
MHPTEIRKPRCFLVCALAPEGFSAAEANRTLNEYVADPARGLCLYHDHFIGGPGGVAVFYVENQDQRAALEDLGPLTRWRVEVRPLVFARSPSAFDEQIAFTLRAYRSADWKHLRQQDRPHYGEAEEEAHSATEV